MPKPTGTQVTIQPASNTYKVGDTFTVEVWVEEVTDLYGADIRLQFNPAAFQVVDANPSQPGVQITVLSDLLKPGFVIHHEADNQAGTIWYANSQVNPASPASGSGALFSFGMSANFNGTFPLTVTSQQLSDQSANPIPATALGATYILTGYNTFLPLIGRGR
jgi:hypothetical protein